MNAPGLEPEAERTLAYYEAVPYLLVLESVERDGEWLRRAAYPELPGCMAEAPDGHRGRREAGAGAAPAAQALVGSRCSDPRAAAPAARCLTQTLRARPSFR